MSIPVNYDGYRPKACAFYAGRAWYSGMPNGEKLGWVLFSQILSDISNINKCYQQNDPTSEVFSDILDDDGGVIQIPDAGEIVALVPLGKGLFVFATNGIWQIIGGDNGFTASTYAVEKVSNIGCLFQKSIVVAEEAVYYWSTSGIYVVLTDTASATAKISNVSDVSIKTFYKDIPTIAKIYAQGKYNGTTKVIHWLYSSTITENTTSGPFKKNRVLAFNTQLNSFYTYTIDNETGPMVMAFTTTKETVENGITFDVVSAGNDVITALGEEVVATIPTVSGSEKQFKYLTTYLDTTYKTTFSDTNTVYFTDWYKYNNVGSEKPSYAVTGYNMGGNGPARNKTAQYVSMFMRATEGPFNENAEPATQSGIKMQTRWDFTNSSNAGKWSPEVQVYRQVRPFFADPGTPYEDGYPLVVTKNKVRGRGKALQIKFSAEEGKDMQIVGWSIPFVNNENI